MNIVEDQFQRGSFLFFGILSVLFAIVTVFGNSFLLYTLYRDPLKCFRTPAAYYIASLAIADLSNGVFVHTIHAVYCFLAYQGSEYPIIYQVFYFLIYVFVTPSQLFMVVIAVERLIAVRWPHKYRDLAKPRLVMGINAYIWLHSIIFAVLPYTKLVSLDDHYLVDLVIHVFSPLVVSTILYSIIFIAVKKRMKSSLGSMTHTAQRKRIALEREKSTTKACILVVVCFFVSYFPYLVLVLLDIYCTSCKGTKAYFFFRNLTIVILFVNPSSNPFIYAWKISSYRRSFLILIKKATSNRIGVSLYAPNTTREEPVRQSTQQNDR